MRVCQRTLTVYRILLILAFLPLAVALWYLYCVLSWMWPETAARRLEAWLHGVR